MRSNYIYNTIGMHYVKKLLITGILSIHLFSTHAQDNIISNLEKKLSTAQNDTIKANTLDSLSMYYMFFTNKYDSCFYYLNKYVDFSFNLKDKKYLVLAYARLGFYYLNTSQYNAGLNISLKGLQLSEQYGINDYISTLYYDISFIYYSLGDSALSIQNAFKGVLAFANNKDPFYDIPLHLYGHISNIYADGSNRDTALVYLHRLDSAVTVSKERSARDISYYYWVNFYLDFQDYPKADSAIALGITSCKKNGDFLVKGFYLYMASSYYRQGRYKETIAAARLANNFIDAAGGSNALSLIQACYRKMGKIDSAYYYLRASDSIQSVVQNQSNINETQQIQFDQQLGKKETQANQVLQSERNRNRQILLVFVTALAFLVLFGFIQWRNSVQRKNANFLLQQQKEKVESTLSELRSAQSQLIQSEKMASLGELTAGIAHEIQNPLNFVNNFSELNKEMIEELYEERNKPNAERNEQLENEILKDIKENEEKINFHGKRAEAIVKGMLQHSRTSIGAKEPTNINALADEYLRLSYHGLRANDKSFNAEIKTDLDGSIGKINIVPQDIGRVLLNLCNNAFYAVNERLHAERTKLNPEYSPLVSLQTKKSGDKITITVRDNGNGIPQKVVDKIFQPFFTTKPTGQGTGLGLSLSYDIIKAHGGEIKVETKEGEGTALIVQLPV